MLLFGEYYLDAVWLPMSGSLKAQLSEVEVIIAKAEEIIWGVQHYWAVLILHVAEDQMSIWGQIYVQGLTGKKLSWTAKP